MSLDTTTLLAAVLGLGAAVGVLLIVAAGRRPAARQATGVRCCA
ncbi:hypothetical protein [Amycolatopsis sp. La24]|nr:hypothetical protein [Amycolatopsis sp. La24]